ncbi:MAG: hypothetical protein PHQ46_13090, partial [Negativicutes bacterium]|nr:hypothetical protein [Negativicutes bacterium]
FDRTFIVNLADAATPNWLISCSRLSGIIIIAAFILPTTKSSVISRGRARTRITIEKSGSIGSV